MEQQNVSNITGSPLGYQVGSAMLGVCFLLGIPGNIVVVVVILRHFNRENFTLHLMLNLAVSDILVLLSIPLIIYNFLDGWHIGHMLCKILYFFIYLSVYVSILTVTLISVHRYVFVLYQHIWAKLGRKGEKALLLILWIIACIPCGVLASTYDVITRNHGISGNFCWRANLTEKTQIAILLFEIVMAFIIPFSIIAASYFCLHKKVNQTTFFSDQRLTRLITSIVVTFLILWTPSHVVSLLEICFIAMKFNENSWTMKRVRAVVDSLIFINSCINPLLYAFSSHALRQTVAEKKGADSAQTQVEAEE